MNMYYKKTKEEYVVAAAELKERYKDKPWLIDVRIGGDDLGKQLDVWVDVDVFDSKKDDDIPRRYKNLDVCVMKKPVIKKAPTNIDTLASQ